MLFVFVFMVATLHSSFFVIIFNWYIECDTDTTQGSELLSTSTESLEKEQILQCMFIIVHVI